MPLNHIQISFVPLFHKQKYTSRCVWEYQTNKTNGQKEKKKNFHFAKIHFFFGLFVVVRTDIPDIPT